MSNELTVVQPQQQAVEVWDEQKLALMHEQLAPDLSPSEFALFVEVCQATGLNPFTREIYAIVRRNGQERKVTYQTGIDGYRKLALASGRYAGSRTYWCDASGRWTDVWLSDEPPAAAKVIIQTPDGGEFEHVALYREYVQRNRSGEVTDMWKRMAANQLAKCAEAGALRKACPAVFKGIYVEDELHQADNPPPQVEPRGRGAAREMMRDGTMAAKAKQAAQPEQWMVELREQVQAWDKSMADLAPLFGASPVTVGAMRRWAESLPDGEDPFAVALKWLREQMANEEPSQDELPFED